MIWKREAVTVSASRFVVQIMFPTIAFFYFRTNFSSVFFADSHLFCIFAHDKDQKAKSLNPKLLNTYATLERPATGQNIRMDVHF